MRVLSSTRVEVDEAAGLLGLPVVAPEGGDDLVGQRFVGFEQVRRGRLGPAGFEGPDLELPARAADLLHLALAQADGLEEVADLAFGGRTLQHDPEKSSFPEIDAELEALEDGDVEDAGEDNDRRDGQGDVLVFQELDVRGFEELHVRYSASWRIS